MDHHSSISFGPSGLATYYDIQGNASLEEAKVVCIADVPTDVEVRIKNAALIDHIWKNHLVLVENVPFGTTQDVVKDELSCRIKVVKEVSGWDLSAFINQAEIMQYEDREFLKAVTVMNEMVLKQKWSFFLQYNGRFAKYFDLYFRPIQGSKTRLLELLHIGGFQIFSERLRSLIEQMKGTWRRKFITLYEQSYQMRVKSLQQAINEGLDEKGKVMICLSGNFVIRNRRLAGEKYDITALQEFLSRTKYVVINPKCSPLKLVDQPHCWGQAPLIPTIAETIVYPVTFSQISPEPVRRNPQRSRAGSLETMPGSFASAAETSQSSTSSSGSNLPTIIEE